MTVELGRKRTYKFDGKAYALETIYMFDELPASVKQRVKRQADAIQARFSRDPLGMDYELKIIAYEELEALLRGHFGEHLDAELAKPDIEALARKFERGGIPEPAVGEEGWEILLAAALVGEHVPYFRVIEPLEEIPRTFIPTLEGDETLDGRRRSRKPPKSELPEHQAREIRLGYWRMLQRIHRGIPGFVGSGMVTEDQFTGGLAGVNTAWCLAPSTMALIDAVPVCGFYLFGTHWPTVMRVAGMGGDHSKMARRLHEEFGMTPDKELRQGTMPHTPKRAAPRVKDRSLLGAPSEGEPQRVRPWGRCDDTLFWRTTPTENDQPVIFHLNPIDIVEVVVDQRPQGLPEGAILVSKRMPAAHAPHGWSTEEFHATMRTLPELLAAAVAVWFGWLDQAESSGMDRPEILNAFARIAQGRKNAILSGLAVLFETNLLHPVDRRLLVVAAGSPAQQDIQGAEAAAQVTEPTVVVDALQIEAVVNEVLASFGVMECN